MGKKQEKKENLTFEEALKKLEEVAEKLEGNDISLEEALDSYEEGVTYYRICESILKDAKQRIETIRAKNLEE